MTADRSGDQVSLLLLSLTSAKTLVQFFIYSVFGGYFHKFCPRCPLFCLEEKNSLIQLELNSNLFEAAQYFCGVHRRVDGDGVQCSATELC